MSVEKLLKQNKTYAEIQKLTGLSKATISYHAKKLGIPRQKQKAYDWKSIQSDIDKEIGITELCQKYKCTWSIIQNAVSKGKITQPKNNSKKWNLDNCFSPNTPRGSLKRLLIKEDVIQNKCFCCGIDPIWNNKPLVFVLDHINGVNNDNRLENLRLLCPNCNSQTETFSGRNKPYKK